MDPAGFHGVERIVGHACAANQEDTETILLADPFVYSNIYSVIGLEKRRMIPIYTHSI